MNIKLELSAEDLKIIEMGLMEIPTKYGSPMIAKINAQIQQQFDSAVDNKDMPTGQTAPTDPFSGD